MACTLTFSTGEECIIEENGSHGICNYLTECESAKKALYSNEHIFPQPCSMEGTMAIICCEEKNVSDKEAPTFAKRDGNIKKSVPKLAVPKITLENEATAPPHPSSRKPGFISKQSMKITITLTINILQ